MSSNALKQSISIKRLLRDLVEVLTEPVPNVRAAPLEDDLFTWHGNMRSHEDEDALGGAILHFVLKFPDNYPSSPPECRLCTPVPHPNVTHKPISEQWARKAPWRLALWDCIPGENFWNRAYSAQSVLVELQAFLFKEDLQYDTIKVEPARAAELALAFKCKACGSSHTNPKPSFESLTCSPVASLQTHNVGVPSFIPARSRSSCLPGITSSAKAVSKPSPVAKKAAVSIAPSQTTSSHHPPASGSNSSSSTSHAVPASSNAAAAEVDDSSAWITVQYKKQIKGLYVTSKTFGKAKAQGNGKGKGKLYPESETAFSTKGLSAASAAALGPVNSSAPVNGPASTHAGGSYAALIKKSTEVVTNNPFQHLEAMDEPDTAVTAAAADGSIKSAPGNSKTGSPAVEGPMPAWFKPLSKTHKKNLARSKKRQAAKGANTGEADSSSTVTQEASNAAGPAGQEGSSAEGPSTSDPPVEVPAAAAGADKNDDGWTTVETKGKGVVQASSNRDEVGTAAASLHDFLQLAPQELVEVGSSDLIGAVSAAIRPDAQDDGRQVPGALPTVSAEYSRPMGMFTPLPRDVMLGILLSLPKPDIASMAACCKGLAAAVGDGELWRALLKQHFPGSRLHVSDASAWRRAYMLQSSLVMDELKCFYSRASFQDEVLGLPVNYTVNPKTELIDYIEALPDMMSVTTFEAGVKKTPSGDKLLAVLPLYITEEHFERAQPYLQKVLRQLAPHKVGPGGRAPPPSAWLEVISKLLNTCVVLLSDKGVVVSERALATYTSVHRLLLALCERYDLWAEAAGRLSHFMTSSDNRTKAVTPNLGELLPLVSLVPHHDWRKVGPAIMNEMFDRNILWMCKGAPGELPTLLAKPYMKDEVDTQMLKLCWEGSVVSKRLMMFHVAFLRMVASPPGMTVADVMDSYDSLYGRPAAGLVRRFGSHVKRIVEEVKTWQQFFQFCCMGSPTDTYLTGWMKQCWQSSLKKKYHSKNTDFSRIQASGVSKILLKGESYSAPPGMKRIELLEHWRWRAEEGVKYLDASCLLYGPQGNFLEVIDYCRTRSFMTQQQGAVQHSGDVMDYAESSGTHTISINLAGLGPEVHFLVITMSSFAGAKLSQIEQPYVRVNDPETGMELCQYHLEDQSMSVKERNSAIIMCSVARKQGNQWDVKAIGHVGQGQAGDYEPIKRNIKNQVLKR